MKAFKHVNATSVKEAIELIRTCEGKASLIAGGTDLLGVLKDEILPDYPAAVINLKTIAGLDRFEHTGNGFKIGALTRLVDVVAHPLIKEKFPALSQAAEAVATPEIRNMATLGGNLCQDTRCWYYRYPHHVGGRIMCHRKGKGPCHAVKGDNRYHAIMGARKCFAVCPSDTAIALSALGAGLEVAGPQGMRKVSIDEFFTPLGNRLETDELLTGIRVPDSAAETRQAFFKFTLKKPVDFAVASVAAIGRVRKNICREVKIVLGAVAPTPWRAPEAEELIRGRTVSEKLIKDAAGAAVEQARPMRMNAYKVEITRTLVERALRVILL